MAMKVLVICRFRVGGDKVVYIKDSLFCSGPGECPFRRFTNAFPKVAFGGRWFFGAATASQYLKTREETRATHTTLILTSHAK